MTTWLPQFITVNLEGGNSLLPPPGWGERCGKTRTRPQDWKIDRGCNTTSK